MSRRLSLALAGSVLFPSAVLADITPADVWARFQATAAAMGGQMTATAQSAGGVLSLDDLNVHFVLPFGAGTVDMAMGSMTLTGHGDGTVSIRYPAEQVMTLSADITGELKVDVTMLARVDGRSDVASGTPDSILFTYDYDRYGLELTDVTIDSPEGRKLPGDAFTGRVELRDAAGTYRFAEEGGMQLVTSEGTIAAMAMEYAFAMTGPDGAVHSEARTTTLGASARSELRLPSEGVPLLALAQALRDGMSLLYSSNTEGMESVSTVRLDDGQTVTQSVSAETNEQSMVLDAEGVRVSGVATGYGLSFDTSEMPAPLAGAASQVEVELAMPLLATDEPQGAVMRMVAEGLTLDDAVWALFDPQAQLPRDPASLTLDLTAGIRPLIDLVDFAALSALDPAETPVEIDSLDLLEFHLGMAGAEALASGAFTFDNDDLDTFDGVPAPDGAVSITLIGANGLIDRLVAMGLLPEDQASMMRMFLAGFTRPGEGQDHVVSDIEVNGENGQITANGQRLR